MARNIPVQTYLPPHVADSKALAIRRLPSVVAKVKSEFEYLRHQAGLTVDHTLLEPLQHDPTTLLPDGSYLDHSRVHELLSGNDGEACPTLAEVYKRYMDDPTNGWTETTRQAYQTTHALVVSVLGAELAIADVSRVEVRQLIEVLRFLPKNSVKIFPKLSPLQASDRGRADVNIEKISTANANSYLGNFSTFMNWCVREELIARNPARGFTASKNTGSGASQRLGQPSPRGAYIVKMELLRFWRASATLTKMVASTVEISVVSIPSAEISMPIPVLNWS
jgi:hypothetical protein